jgi:ElaB/YqjD/DUF883 family membrane-anchored ribosome-binding protein
VVKISDGLKKFSLDELVGKLLGALTQFAKDMEEVVGENKAFSFGDIQDLRRNIQQRLNNKEEIRDNTRLLAMLDLFATDKAVLEIIREDAEGWIELLEGIEENIKGGPGGITPQEQKEITQIKELTAEIKDLIRKN